jgi:hypothetical protein
MDPLRTTIPSHKQRKVMRRQRKTLGSGVNSISPWHNTDECHSKQSLVAELKASKLEACSNSKLVLDKGKQIINVEPSAIIATTNVQPSEPKEPEEGECLFHSQMWVKGALLHFIVDSRSQKNLISTEVVKWLDLPTTPHPKPYTIGWLCQGRDIHANQQCCLPYDIKPFKDEVLCDIFPLNFVTFF